MFNEYQMPFWYASFVFLGLSVSFGILIYIFHRDKKRKKKQKEMQNKLWDNMKTGENKDKKSTIESLTKELKEKGKM